MLNKNGYLTDVDSSITLPIEMWGVFFYAKIQSMRKRKQELHDNDLKFVTN